MADADAAKRKREERRARILANSEQRMSRIHGQAAAAPSSSSATVSAPSPSKAGVPTAPSAASTPAHAPAPTSETPVKRTVPAPSVSTKTAPAVEPTKRVPTPARAPPPKQEKRASLTASPPLTAKLAQVIGPGDIAVVALGVAMALITIYRVGAENVYEEFALGTVSSTWPIVVPFVLEEVGVNGAGLEVSKNPITIAYGFLGLCRRLLLYLFCFFTTFEFVANRMA